MTIEQILASDNPADILPLFEFTLEETDEVIAFKFGLWARFFFYKYFTVEDAPFHKAIDKYNIQSYRGTIKSFTDIAFRGAAKTSRTKLFIAFVILNDRNHYRKYIKVLTKDATNGKQITTDTYNMFVDSRVQRFYPGTFAKTAAKREETMASYTTATGIKVLSDTVGTDQRGQAQEHSRPDWIIFDDFETRKTLRSAVESMAIWDNMKEARDGLAIDGSCIYNCNYLSERGNVHKLVKGADSQNVVLITPILDEQGVPAWSIYTPERIEEIKSRPDTDFEGEYMCSPSASHDVIFDRKVLQEMKPLPVLRDVAGLKIFRPYDPSHFYALAADISGGVGLDSSTIAVIDFGVAPCRVVATYKSNIVKPDTFAYEIQRAADMYGGCLVAPEKNNMGAGTIAILKTLDGVDLLKTPTKDVKNELREQTEQTTSYEYGWHTNGATKPKMTFAFKKAIEAEPRVLELSDPDLIAEAMSYARDDLMDRENDPRLSTRHFDLLTAAMICWQMQEEAVSRGKKPVHTFEEDEPIYADIGV